MVKKDPIKYTQVTSKRFLSDLDKLVQTRKTLKKSFEELKSLNSVNPYNQYHKKLIGYKDYHRYKFKIEKELRAIARINDKILEYVMIGKRKNIYERFKHYLKFFKK